MAISLKKGEKINLSKEVKGVLNRVRIGLGWDPNKYDNGKERDLDVTVIGLKKDGNGQLKMVSEDFFVFYGHLNSADGAIVHFGDNKDGGGDGDDETVTVDFTKIDARVEEIAIIVTIHKAQERGQNFGQVENSYCKIYNDETGEEIAKFSLEDEASRNTAVQFGALQKRDSGWLFAAAGNGYDKGLGDFVRLFGGEVGDE